MSLQSSLISASAGSLASSAVSIAGSSTQGKDITGLRQTTASPEAQQKDYMVPFSPP